MLNLIMQPAQHALARHTVVVLHKIQSYPRGLPEFPQVKALKEESPVIPKYLRLDDQDARQGSGGDLDRHLISRCVDWPVFCGVGAP